MKLGKLVKGGLGVLATAGAAAINPALGAVVGSALGGGAAAKAVGKRVEKRTGKRLHKVGAPLAAAGLPAALVGSGAIDFTTLCDAITQLCASPVVLASALGALMTWLHQLVSGAGKITARTR